MTINSTLPPSASTTPGATVRDRLSVPWGTVVPLAVVMALADGFWMTSVRNAVGAIERTQQPFASFLVESTLLLPTFLFAVLAALTLALRRFGSQLPKPRMVMLTALLIVAAGTAAAVINMAASAVFDYRLQSHLLTMMTSMNGTCTNDCLALQQQSTLAAHARAIAYTTGLVLVTNLVLVSWVVAMRGGRIRLITSTPQTVTAADPVRVSRNKLSDVRLLLVAGLLGSAAIHAAVVPEHLSEWRAAGLFFILLATAEVAVVQLPRDRRPRLALFAAAGVSLAPLALWVYSRTAGLPFGPEAGVPEAVGIPDSVASVLEVGTLFASIVLLRAPRWLGRPTATAHVRTLMLLAVIALTAIGLAGTSAAWFDVYGSGDPGMVMPR